MSKKPPRDDGPVTEKELASALFSLAPPPATPTIEIVAATDVKASIVQEIILSGFADLHLRARSGLFGKDEANTMEKLIGFAKEFATIAQAINDVADYRPSVAADSEQARVHVSESVQRLRAAMGKPRS